MEIKKKTIDSQMESLKPASAARMNRRAIKKRNILNSMPKNLYRVVLSGSAIFPLADITPVLRLTFDYYKSFPPKIKAFLAFQGASQKAARKSAGHIRSVREASWLGWPVGGDLTAPGFNPSASVRDAIANASMRLCGAGACPEPYGSRLVFGHGDIPSQKGDGGVILWRKAAESINAEAGGLV